LFSLSGGIVGCLLGVIASYILEFATGIETIVSFGSILLSFLVATFIGLIFGVLPAKSAANKNRLKQLGMNSIIVLIYIKLNKTNQMKQIIFFLYYFFIFLAIANLRKYN